VRRIDRQANKESDMAATRSPTRPSYLRIFVGLVLVVAVLYLAKTVIVPLVLAVLLTFVLTPIVSAVQRLGLKRVYAVLLTVLLTFVVFGAVGWAVGVQVHHLARELPTHRKQIDAKIASLRGSGEGTFSDLLQMIREIGKGEEKADLTPEEPAPKEKMVVAQPEEASSFERLARAGGPVLGPLAQASLVIILVVFMLIKREDLRNRLISLLGHGQLTGTTRVLVDAAGRLSRLLLNQLCVNAAFGLLFGIGLFVFKVPYPALWGFLAAVLRFVPFIGSWVAAAFPLVLSFATAPGWTQPVLVFAYFAVLDLVTGNVVEPLLFGRSTGVTPVALLIAAAFWMWLWGPMGLVLSTPLTVCLVVLGQHVPRLRFLALLLGDQPALDPHQSYYQRLLARDRAEAKEVATEYARTHGREKVYDDVFLPALVRARRDHLHAGLTAEDEGLVFEATREIVDQLKAGPAAAGDSALQSSVVILGCPAHHEAEELPLHMLAQLLDADGCRVEVMSTRALPAEVEARVEQEQPALVFVAVLPPGGLVQARYVCRRLRRRFAGLKIVVGYWGEARDFDRLLVRLRSAGVNYVTTSLLQSRSQIQALVRTAPPAQPLAQEPALHAAGSP
jgi:predicted PurR-regulated permease PerM